jgi:hypothetical protein
MAVVETLEQEGTEGRNEIHGNVDTGQKRMGWWEANGAAGELASRIASFSRLNW